jgi:predicted metal-dependent phosphoesterase TrpH
LASLRKADLHLHTRHSGWQRLGIIDSLDCYLDPVAVVETALQRGMDYAALTDHDSIGGWLEVRRRRPDLWPRIIPGVETETVLPAWGLKVHVNVLGLDEHDYEALQPLRRDACRLLASARARGLVTILNHPLRTLWTHPRLRRFAREVPQMFAGVEVLNSASPAAGNGAAASLAASCGVSTARVGGSDAHTLPRVALAWTVAPGETAAAFLDSVRRGECAAAGRGSGLAPVIADVYRVVGRYYASLGGSLFAGQPGKRLRNLLWAAVLVPGALTFPALMTALNDAQHRLLGRWLTRHGPAGAVEPGPRRYAWSRRS